MKYTWHTLMRIQLKAGWRTNDSEIAGAAIVVNLPFEDRVSTVLPSKITMF